MKDFKQGNVHIWFGFGMIPLTVNAFKLTKREHKSPKGANTGWSQIWTNVTWYWQLPGWCRQYGSSLYFCAPQDWREKLRLSLDVYLPLRFGHKRFLWSNKAGWSMLWGYLLHSVVLLVFVGRSQFWEIVLQEIYTMGPGGKEFLSHLMSQG